MTHLSRGALDKEIADLLSISIWTVHNHLKNIYEKLGVQNRTEAVMGICKSSVMTQAPQIGYTTRTSPCFEWPSDPLVWSPQSMTVYPTI